MGSEVKNKSKNKKVKKVFLDDLPRWEYGCHKGRFNWKKCVGHKARFIYDDIEGEVEIEEYIPQKCIVVLRYKEKVYSIATTGFVNCQLGGLLNKKTIEFKVELGTTFKDYNRDLVINDREYRKRKNGKSTINDKWYKYKCNKCGWDEGWIVECHLIKGTGCSCCANKTVIEGINDIPTTAPWMIKYFQGGYDEAKLYTQASHKKITPICPDCGRIKDKAMSIDTIYTYRSISCICSDGISFSEKFMFNVLEQLNLEFQIQLSKKTFEWCGSKKYDFYFKYNNLDYIVETHGKQHYEEGFKRLNRRTLKQEKINDKVKKELALANKIKEKNYIMIDCRKSEMEWVRNNILSNKKLNRLFDLSNIDWNKCLEFACSDLVKKVCDLWEREEDITVSQIKDIMKLSEDTVRRHLKKGSLLGWCDYDVKKSKLKGCRKSGKMNGKTVEIFKDGISLGIFESCTELDKQSEELFGVRLGFSKIAKVCRDESRIYKGYTFKYINQ